MKNTKAIVFGGFMILVVAGLIVGINLQTPVSVQQQTIPSTSVTLTTPAGTVTTPADTTTAIIKTCDSSSPITITALCQLSTKQGNATVNSPLCPAGGIPVDGKCPTTVVPLASNTIIDPPVPITPPAPTPETIQLLGSVTVTDNSGVTTPLQANSILLPLNDLFPQLSLTAIHGMNTNISTGNLKVAIVIQASPNENIIANGTFWVSVGTQQLHPQGLQWAANGITGTDGKLVAKIATPAGIISQYTFDIAKNAAILQHSTNQINFTVSNVQIQNGKGQSYHNQANQNIFKTVIDYDPNLTIVKNSDGTSVRAYPSDDTFTISASNVATYPPYDISNCRSAGCVTSQERIHNTPINHVSVPAGSAKVYLEQNGVESLIGSTTSIGTSGTQTIKNIPRNADIKIVVIGGTLPTTQLVHSPVTQKLYSYSCTYTGCIFK